MIIRGGDCDSYMTLYYNTFQTMCLMENQTGVQLVSTDCLANCHDLFMALRFSVEYEIVCADLLSSANSQLN